MRSEFWISLFLIHFCLFYGTKCVSVDCTRISLIATFDDVDVHLRRADYYRSARNNIDVSTGGLGVYATESWKVHHSSPQSSSHQHSYAVFYSPSGLPFPILNDTFITPTCHRFPSRSQDGVSPSFCLLWFDENAKDHDKELIFDESVSKEAYVTEVKISCDDEFSAPVEQRRDGSLQPLLPPYVIGDLSCTLSATLVGSPLQISDGRKRGKVGISVEFILPFTSTKGMKDEYIQKPFNSTHSVLLYRNDGIDCVHELPQRIEIPFSGDDFLSSRPSTCPRGSSVLFVNGFTIFGLFVYLAFCSVFVATGWLLFLLLMYSNRMRVFLRDLCRAGATIAKATGVSSNFLIYSVVVLTLGPPYLYYGSVVEVCKWKCFDPPVLHRFEDMKSCNIFSQWIHLMNVGSLFVGFLVIPVMFVLPIGVLAKIFPSFRSQVMVIATIVQLFSIVVSVWTYSILLFRLQFWSLSVWVKFVAHVSWMTVLPCGVVSFTKARKEGLIISAAFFFLVFVLATFGLMI